MTIERVIGSMVVMWMTIVILFCACGKNNKIASCGDGVVTFPETCDTLIPEGQPGACPTNCGSGNPCVLGALWNAGTCTAMCTQAQVLPCCGNRLLERNEICETSFPEGMTNACPKSCNDGNVCTRDTLENAGTCTDRCIYTPIADCRSNDGCCPLGGNCTSNNDSDCACVCGNGVVEPGCCEQCDPTNGTTCDANCHDSTLVDLAGTWIARFTTSVKVNMPNPFPDSMDGTIDFVQRIVVTKSDGILNLKFDICSLNVVVPVFTYSINCLSKVLETFTTTATQQDLCMLVGGEFTFPTFTIISGWGGPPAPVPPGCVCPRTGEEGFPVESCCGAIDSDGDGIYGITLDITMFQSDNHYDDYDGLNITEELNGMKLTNATTITGANNFKIEGYVFGTPWSYGKLKIIPDSATVPFALIKLNGDVQCPEVLQKCAGATCVP